jgi:hypothetical protein
MARCLTTMLSSGAWLRLLLLCAPFAEGIDPEFMQDIVVYHVNPSHLGAIPVNMVRTPAP